MRDGKTGTEYKGVQQDAKIQYYPEFWFYLNLLMLTYTITHYINYLVLISITPCIISPVMIL
jgi:hypothetical protein